MPERPTQTLEPGERVRDRVKRAASTRFWGRDAELAWLERALFDEHAAVVFVHGLGGIGKSSLLDAAEVRIAARGARMLRLVGHDVEPTPEGLTLALLRSLGEDGARLEALVHALDANASDVVIAIDEYDGLRLLEVWLRRTFLPELPAHVRLLLVGRSRPRPAWSHTPGWDGLVRSLELGPMRDEDAGHLLDEHAFAPALRERLLALSQGHPLALKLAARAAVARPHLPLAELTSRHVVDELVQRFLSDVDDPSERAVVEAASVVRRVTRPLLDALLDGRDAERAFDSLRHLPFVETGVDGLVLHQSVRQAVESTLRTLDPVRHRELRSRAFRKLQEEVQRAPKSRRWQLTADLLYLIDYPAIREAFFPSDVVTFGVEPATARDAADIHAITRAHVGEREASVLERWWELLPEAFQVVRDAEQRVIAFYVIAFEHALPEALVQADPLLPRWKTHRQRTLASTTRPVLFQRATLSAQAGTARCEERAACFVDIKRLYMQNLDLAAIYVASHDGGGPTPFKGIGFVDLPELILEQADSLPVTSSTLRFGAGVLSWLSSVVDAQCEPDDASSPSVSTRPFVLDRATRELVIDGRRTALTRLEYGVLDQLEQNAGAVLSRDQLLESTWGQAHSGSNVVDAVVRTLRKKLGPHADAIQTVTGFGYKLR